MDLEDFESVFGEPKVEWSVATPVRRFLFQVHAPDSSHLKVDATDFFSSSFGAVLSIQQLQDMRSEVGIGGSWSEFLEYVVDSIKFGDVKLVLEGKLKSNGPKSTRLIAQKSKGMPQISFSMLRLVGTATNETMSMLSLDLYKAHKTNHKLRVQEQEGQNELTKISSTTPSLEPKREDNNIQEHYFEIKPQILLLITQTCQFDGNPEEDPYSHLSNFKEICGTFTIRDVTKDAIHLRLFPFSLRNKARDWIRSLPNNSETTWEKLSHKFLMRYFPQSKMTHRWREILRFSQIDGETLYDSWERFCGLLRRCPTHGLSLHDQIMTFYNGLFYESKQSIDAAAQGIITYKTPTEAYNLIDDMAINSYKWDLQKESASQHDDVVTLSEKVNCLNWKVDKMMKERCNDARDCQEGYGFIRNE